MFRKELEILINRYSKENYSNTPDHMLANYLIDCLEAYNKIIRDRDDWYNWKPSELKINEKN